MLDKKINIYQKDRLVPYEKTIKEYKAPTDESIKLLNDFQEKSKENIIKSIQLKNNIFEAFCIIFAKNIYDQSIEMHIRFILNGKDFLLKEKLSTLDFFNKEESGIINVIYEKVSKEITKELINKSNKNIGEILIANKRKD